MWRPIPRWGSRMHLIRLPGERLVIDDCYNANPQSMAEGLRMLGCQPRPTPGGGAGRHGRAGTADGAGARDMGALTRGWDSPPWRWARRCTP